MINWHIVTSEVFHNGSPVSGDMYFLSDTREIYRGADPFTESVILCTSLPNNPALNRLYINSATLEGKVWQGAENGWATVINAVSDTVIDSAMVPVSGKAVVAYVAAEIAKTSNSANSISALTWDSSEHLLSITKGDNSNESIVFDGLGVSLNYTASTGELQMLDASGNLIGDPIKLDLERFVSSGEYDANSKSIFLYFDAEKTDHVEIPVGDLVDVYTVEGSSSLNLSISGNKITGSVKISTASGNAITIDEHGLYVAPVDLSGKMDKQHDAVEGNIAVFDANGQVIDSGTRFDDINNNCTVYRGASIDEAVAGNIPVKGNFCIVSTAIGETGKYQHTAYIYNGESWEALDGNYSAENIIFPENLLTTSAIGNITLNNGQATVPAAGKNLLEVWNSIFVKPKDPSVTQPSVSLTFNQAGSYEVGSNITPTYTASLNAGKYEFGPATGITASSWEISNSDGGSSTNNSGSFDSIEVNDNTNYTITAKANYEAGTIPVNNIGNPVSSKQIAAGSKSKSSSAITGFRRGFYGYLTEKLELTSDVIRSLTCKTDATPTAGNEWEIPVPVGAIRVVFAYPATIQDVTSVIDTGGMNATITGAFTKNMKQVDVEGLNNHTAIPYKVYFTDFANANDTDNVYKVII